MTRPAWVPCPCCPEFWCTRHGCHAFECPCPPIEEWDIDPYSPPTGDPMPATPTTPGARLRAARLKLGLTQVAAAARLGIPQPVLSQAENDGWALGLDWLHDAAGKLGCDPGDLDERLAPAPRKKSRKKSGRTP